jgi:hypothetical protein
LSAWNYVVAVHLCTVVRTRERGTSATGSTVNYDGCPENANEVLSANLPKTANDGALRRTYRQVFTVRAQATGAPAIRGL